MEAMHNHRRTPVRGFSRSIPYLLAAVLLLVQAAPLPTPQTSAAAKAEARQATETTVYLDPVADASLDQTDPGAPLGLQPDLRLFWMGQNEAGRALLRFNLAAALPPEAIIDAAFLELVLESGSAEGPTDITATNVLADWIEAEVTWESQPDAGGPATINPVDAVPGLKQLDVTEVVQAWHNQPHYGLLLAGPEGMAPYDYTFASRNSEVVEDRPRLEVTYHLPPTEVGFAGQVTWGEPPEPGEPLPGATIELYGDGDASPTNGRGLWLASVQSDGAGAFELAYGGEPFPFYHVVQAGPEGTYPSGAEADPPGIVTAPNTVTYEEPGSGIYEGIGFWNRERPEGCDELLANGDFEAGELESWGRAGTVALGPGREGGQAAQFAGADEVMGELWQEVTIPFEAGPVLMTFWWMAEAEIQQPGDALDVIMQHAGGDDHLMSLPATGALGTWRYGSLDLTGYGGTQGAVTFLAHTDGEVPTTFRVDDVRVTSCGGFLPDLVVTDLWPEQDHVCYQIRNQGDYVAPEGHTTELLRPEVGSLAWDWVAVPLAPGERHVQCFDYAWTCTGSFDALLVRTDTESVVPEWHNDNNWREESWQCDVAPPAILTGPGVTAITENSAVVTWETDEPGDSQVFYSTLSRGPGLEAYSEELVASHEVLLPDLVPNTVYSYTVTSADEMGNRSAGVAGTFQTLPQDDGADPNVSLRDPDNWRGLVQLVADAVDNERVEKVAFCLESATGDVALAPAEEDEFCLAGELLFTDYSAPFEAMVDTTQYANGDYTVTAKVYDPSGRSATDQVGAQFANLVDPNAPVVTITNPTSGQVVSGKVQVTAQLSDDQGLAYVYFWINGQFGQFNPLPTHPKSTTLTYDWDTTVVTQTNISIAVEALDSKFNKGQAIVSVQVSQPSPPLQPKLKVIKHTVTRKKNALEVALTVGNVGQGTAQNVLIVDSLRSFQPISRSATAPHAIEYEASYVPSTKLWQEVISDTQDLAPGAWRTYTYSAIPVMVYPGTPTPSVGETVHLYYEDTAGKDLTGQVQVPVTLTTGGTSIGQAWTEALKQATYLIVTNPQRLFWYHVNPGPVDDLLSAMAELAYHKNGALGYLYLNDKHALDALIEPFNLAAWAKYGDNWSVRLHPNFLKLLSGALLIVGEVEIVPAWQSNFNVGWSPVPYSDQPYADTGGSPAPELLVGRIVGDKATTMIKPIQASIGVHTGASGYAFDHLKAMTVSGPGLGTFVQDVDDATLNLHDAGWLVAEVHTKQYFQIGDFIRDYEPGDDLAVGEIDSSSSDEEIVIADKSTNKVYIYDKNGTSLAEFYVGYGISAFDDGDQIAIASGRIIMADASADRILVYGYDTGWVLETSFSVAFDPGDVLAAGDVLSPPSPLEEIVVADHSANQIEHYSVAGLKYTQKVSATFDPRDLMAVGDVLGDGKDEVVLGDRSSGKLLIYSGQGTLQGSHQLKDVTVDGTTMSRLEYYDYDVQGANDVGGTGLAIGDLFPYPPGADSHKEEILLAPARNYDHLFPFWWNASKSELRGAAVVPWNLNEYDGLAIGEMGTYLGLAQDEILVADRVGYVRLLDTNNWGTRWNAAKPTYFPNTDLLYLSGHGNVDGCCGLSSYSGGTFPIDFNKHNPVAIGMSCLTGNYQDKADSSNFPDRLLDSGAAVYIGATQESSGYENREAAKWLFKNWDYGEAIGKVFTELERSYWKGSATNDWWWYWAYEYNLYGDPLFAAVTTSAAQDLAERTQLGNTLSIDVPPYVVTTTQGLDWVEIPGGGKRSDPGDLWLPYYTTLVEVPAGQRIQDVTLVERTGLMTDTGLILPMVPVTLTACACSPEPYSGPVVDWYPQEVYDWEVLDNGDGTTTLRVTVHPFYYNPLTTASRFYQNYTFDVTTVPGEVTITGLVTDKGAYGPGEPVNIDVELENAGAPRDVVASTVIKAMGSGVPVAGLPLVALDGLKGPASLSATWDSSGAPGSYLVEVTLQAADSGQILDVETHSFALGIAGGTITEFSAWPRVFEVGDGINLSLTFENTGTVPVDGTALIQVVAESDEVVAEFQHEIAGLGPGVPLTFDDLWDTAAVTEGTYRIVASVSYAGASTDPVLVTVSTERDRTYLPLVVRDGP